VGDIDGHIVDHGQGEWETSTATSSTIVRASGIHCGKKKKKNQFDAMAALKAAEPAQVSRHSMLL
jgi:hypothetical protein